MQFSPKTNEQKNERGQREQQRAQNLRAIQFHWLML
jgi:hypothetical protein